MEAEIQKSKKGPKEKPTIKVPNKYFSYMNIYCEATKITMPKLIEKIMSDFFSKDEIRKVLEENDELSKMKQLYEKKKNELEQLGAEIAELEKK